MDVQLNFKLRELFSHNYHIFREILRNTTVDTANRIKQTLFEIRRFVERSTYNLDRCVTKATF